METTTLFVFSSKESFSKYVNFVNRVSMYGLSVDIILLSENKIKIEEIYLDEFLLVFTESSVDFKDMSKVRRIEGLTEFDVIDDILCHLN